MNSNQDFVIENGVLTKYKGPGGDVTIPMGVKKIGDYAFDGCTGLTSVVIPAGVKKIGYGAFSGCTGLTSVVIPAGVTAIGNYAFYGCTSLTSVVIPAGVTAIGNSAFSGCKDLTSVVIPESVTAIRYSAFDGCKGLTSVVIPAGVKSIEYSTFSGCEGLTSVTIPESVTAIGNSAFSGCTGLTSVTIPESVTEIGNSAFYGCTGLQKVDLPRSIRKMGVDRDGEKLYPTMPEGLPLTTDKLNQGIAAQIDHVWHEQMTVKDWAGLYLFQTAKAFQALYGKYMKAPAEEYLSAMLELLEGGKNAYVQAANYAVDHARELSPESIQTLYNLAAAKKDKKALELLELLVKDTKTPGGT